MLQAYSSNVSIAANAACPFNNVVLDKGCAEALSGNSTIQLNRCGVYLVEFDAYCTPAAAGLVSFQLYKDGVAQPQAVSSFTGTAATVDACSFKTFVQVSQNNTNCCCSSPVILRVNNGVTAVNDAHVNICVTKIC